MKKLACTTALAVGCSAVSGLAADMTMLTKAPPAPAVTSPWDIGFGSAIMSDYIFRGITQSNHKPSVAAYFEPRYNFNGNLQGYLGISAESISFPNRAAAEIDFYGGIRPTFGKLALDFGGWYYYYPGGDCFSNLAFTGADCTQNGALPVNFNVVKADVSFVEAYAKATYTFSDAFSAGASAFYSPSVLNSGANGTYAAATAKYVLPGNFLFKDVGWFISGDAGYWFLGTSDLFIVRRRCREPVAARIRKGSRIIAMQTGTWALALPTNSSLLTCGTMTRTSIRATATRSPAHKMPAASIMSLPSIPVAQAQTGVVPRSLQK